MYIYELRKLVKLVDEFITFCFYNVSELLFYQIWGLQILVKLVVNNNILSTMDVQSKLDKNTLSLSLIKSMNFIYNKIFKKRVRD